MKKIVLISSLTVLFTSCTTKPKTNAAVLKKPNIIFIYLDDLGYGDVSAYGATELNTPNMDFLANNGRKFTNGYATSATCTPSRYALLTGQYPWRNRNAKILPGTAPLVIDTAQVTLPKMLRKISCSLNSKYHLDLLGKYNLAFLLWTFQPNALDFFYGFH